MRPGLLLVIVASSLVCGCAVRPGASVPRRGDEIVVCGQLFRTGAPVVLWSDPGGYDAYRVERRFAPTAESSWKASAGSLDTPNRYGLRAAALSTDEIERVRGGGWDLATLRRVIDQFVIHYDAAGTSRNCFRILHDVRGLSVHFMLDVDGTIYQTLDVKERAWHATIANDRSIGIEIANIGAYPPEQAGVLDRWYARDGRGVILAIPPDQGDGGVRTPGFVGRPARDGPIHGVVQGRSLVQHDLTPEQYESLARLTAALCEIFPNLPCDYPRDAGGELITYALPPEQFSVYRGLLGHYHVQENKVDPGPAFQWERLVRRARRR